MKKENIAARSVGRPAEYSKAILDAARDYSKNYFVKYKDLIPTAAGLALAIGKSRETVYAWAKDPDKAEFSDILEELETKQCQKLINGGLSNEFNANITKMMLTKHGYSDRQDVNISGHTTSDVRTLGVVSIDPEQLSKTCEALRLWQQQKNRLREKPADATASPSPLEQLRESPPQAQRPEERPSQTLPTKKQW